MELEDPSMMLVNEINPLEHIRNNCKLTFSGHGGRNERTMLPQTLIKALVWPGKHCGIIHTLPAMGWHSVGSPGLVGLWMRQHDLDWCLVAHQNNDCTFTVTVADYSHLGELLDSRRYWAYIPMSSAAMDSESQRLVLEYQLNTQLEQHQTNQE